MSDVGAVLGSFDVVTLGETMVQLVPGGMRLVDADCVQVGIGGAESNTACYLAAAGHRVAWVSAVGDDPFGVRMRREIASYGVDTTHVVVDPGAPTGVYFKDPAPGGTAVYYYRAGSAASRLSVRTAHVPQLGGVRVFHHSGVSLALSTGCAHLVQETVAAARQAGTIVSFDINYRPRLWSVQDAAPVLLAHAAASDLVFIGLDEACTLFGCTTPAQVRDLLPDTELVIKDGPIGATTYTSHGETFAPAHTIEVLEPVGAGDAFAAGYLHALLNHAPTDQRLSTGHDFAALALQSLHDVPPPHTLHTLTP